MKNEKISDTPPLVENEITINDAFEKSNLFNNFFASKSTVKNYKDPAPNLVPLENIPTLRNINTSPIEVAKLIRNIKKISPFSLWNLRNVHKSNFDSNFIFNVQTF